MSNGKSGYGLEQKFGNNKKKFFFS